jgi:hypothetical protein
LADAQISLNLIVSATGHLPRPLPPPLKGAALNPDRGLPTLLGDADRFEWKEKSCA